MDQLTENVFYMNRYPTVGMVVTSEGVLAVDGPMKPADAVEWRDFIAAKGPLRYNVNTEHHQDHIASNWYLGADTIISSEITYANFLTSLPSTEVAKERMLKYDPECGKLLEGYELRWPDITYRSRMTLRLGGQTFHLIHSPGHTRGQTVVHAVEARVAFTADNITPGDYPFFHSASVWEWFQSLAMLEALDVDWYVPGHGEPCRKDEIARQRQKMFDVIEEVRVVKDKGASREEAQEKVNYIDRPGLDFPRVLGDRAYVLQKASVGTVYDFLDEHPSGGFGAPGHTV